MSAQTEPEPTEPKRAEVETGAEPEDAAQPDDGSDLRSILGLGGRSRLLWVGLLELAVVLLMLRSAIPAVERPTVFVGFALIAVAATVVILPATDPLPLPHTWFVVAVGPLATYLTNRGDVDAIPPDHLIWTSLAYEMVLALLAIRGRILLTWVCVATTAAVAAVVGSQIGVDAAGLAGLMTPVGVVAAISIFAAIMRRTPATLRALRVDATISAAAEATIAAQNDERDRQLARLDIVARPILERIGSGVPLTDDERAECGLLEAELRDGLRAPQLTAGDLPAAARGARSRGVEVILLDDGGLADATASMRDHVIATAAAELDAATGGTVTVRVLPVRRRLLATIVATEPGQHRRTEVDATGIVETTIRVDHDGDTSSD